MVARHALSGFFGLALALVVPATTAQQCYNPDGSEAPDSFPCGSGSTVQCCPYQWQCLDNGLCFNPAADNLMGRYACTDQNWTDGACPNFCTRDASQGGNEAVLACDDGRWCCDKDRQSGNCCTDSGFEFISLAVPTVYATMNRNSAAGTSATGAGPSLPSAIRNGQVITSAALSSAQSSAAQTTDNAQSSAPVQTSAAPETTQLSTALETRVSSGSAGISTQVVTSVRTIVPTVTSSSSNNGSNSSSGGSNTGLIVGCAVGIPVGLALIGGLSWLLYRRRQKKASAPTAEALGENGTAPSSGAAAAGGFYGKSAAAKHSTDSTIHEKTAAPVPPYAVEIDGTQTQPVTSELPNNEKSRPISELYGSTPSFPPSSNTNAPLRVVNERDSVVSSLSPSVAGENSPNTPVSAFTTTPEAPSTETFPPRDLRTQGAHAAHFGGGGLLGTVDEAGENAATSATQASTTGDSTQPQQYQPYRPPQ